MTNLDQYLEWLPAVFNSERSQILGLIIESPRSAAELTRATGLAPDTVADHLGLLRSLDIVAADGTGQAAIYRLNEERIRRASSDLAMIPDDVRSLSGQVAPHFRLPAAHGEEVALADCLAQGPTIVWFSRGLYCPICRRQRSQLTRGHAGFHALGAKVLEITPTPPERARFYFSHYDLAFPYLCDPSGTTAALYGVKRGRFEPLLLLRVILADWLGSRQIARERLHGPHFEPVAEEASSGAEEGFFIIDRSGLIRFADIGPYRRLPSNREIEAQLRDSLN